MNPGTLDKRIQLISTSQSFDKDGYPIEENPIPKKLWAQVIPVSAKDYNEAKATQTENITKFIIRYSKSLEIDNTMIVLYKKKRFEIESVLNDEERNVTLTIVGREVS